MLGACTLHGCAREQGGVVFSLLVVEGKARYSEGMRLTFYRWKFIVSFALIQTCPPPNVVFSGMASSPTMILSPAAPSKVKLRTVQSPFKSNILKNEVAIITGGASGIGFEITRQLGLHGAKVVIMGRRAEVLEAAVKSLTSQGIQAHSVRGDVRSAADAQKTVAETVEKFGYVSMLVNSAAGSQLNALSKCYEPVLLLLARSNIASSSHRRNVASPYCITDFLVPAEDLAPKGFQTVMEIDALGVFTMSHAAFQQLKKHGDSIILNISAMLHQPATWYQVRDCMQRSARYIGTAAQSFFFLFALPGSCIRSQSCDRQHDS